ncbi:MAG: DNA polymerase I [Oscillospiraceae bacterium]|nr:DNA polymerase I [Oscillospiraceae bacterium]
MKLLAIEGNSIVNRAYFGIRMLNAPDGTPTNAVYGFVTILRRLLDEERPEGVVVAFDLKAPTFRHLRYEGYKAQRKGMPEELAVQMPILKEVLDAMGILRIEKEGFEADDLLGTVSRICEGAGDTCAIATGDRDSFQLITDATRVLHIKTRMGQTETVDYTRARFEEEYGFAPPRIVDLKALMGDASDNIPGVAGVGEKTALDLIRRYDSIARIYEDLDALDIKEGVRKKLAAGRDMAALSYELATIITDVPLELTPEQTVWNQEYAPELYGLFLRLGFTKFIDKWHIRKPEEPAEAPETRQVTCTMKELRTEAEALAAADAIADTGRVLFIRATPEYDLFAFELEAESGEAEETTWILDRARYTGDWGAALRALLAYRIPKAGHNIKDLQRAMMDFGVPIHNWWCFDTALAGYLLDATAGSYDLRRLCVQYCGFEPFAGLDRTEDGGQMSLLDSGAEDPEKLRAERCAVLASEAAAIAALHDPMQDALTAQGMERLFYDIELPLCPVLAEMEHEGFLVDRAALSEFGASMTDTIDALQKSIWEQAGEEFNINSPKQLGAVLFEKLMLPAGKKTKTGWSTNADVLEKLRDKHPIVEEILKYRELTKLKSTYADGLLKVIGPDGRIRTNFQMTVTATGRLSSTEPNLQNIPIRREFGGQIRRMFVAPAGRVLVDADYSQIELRLLAHISGDENLIAAFRSGEDVHAVTASQVFGIPLDQVTRLQRSHAKAVNFGIVYGISAWSLAQDIGVFPSEAKAYMEAYLEKYHGVRDYQKRIVAQAKADGYVSTLYGRRRALPELKSSNFAQRSFGERVALNMPIQGTAADVIKLAMVAVWRRLNKENLKARLILQVHDELIAECPEAEAERVKAILTEEMQNAASFAVPLTVDCGAGESWAEAH